MQLGLTDVLADSCELATSDLAAAHALLREKRPDLPVVMAEVGGSFIKRFGEHYRDLLTITQNALALSFVRMASRHGIWGNDYHAYHNEEHALELLNGRLARVRIQLGWSALEAEEWILLALFSTCHDLRQRETPHFIHNVGANERASIAETHRILELSGFSRVRHAEFYDSLLWMIAGSTFDARPEDATQLNSAEAANSGGSLSSALVRQLQDDYPTWQSDPILRRRVRAMLVSSDLDTANVGEPFTALAASATRLIIEREMRAGRDLSGNDCADEVLEFLTDGQERYFFKLHRFVSDIGQNVFGPGKTMNSPRLKKLADTMRERFPHASVNDHSGQSLIDAFNEIAHQLR